MQHEATSEKNYVTIEDPVEYYLDMAGQIMVKDKVGLDFATILRSILRQDPDVILLGEIRDHETAEVAFHAALTGHLVFSTLHTNSALGTLARLYDLGLKPFAIASAVEAIIAQRLVRKICNGCNEPFDVPREKLDSLGPFFQGPSFKTNHGTGCKKCGFTGYSGRIGIYEVLVPNMEIQSLIATDASMSSLHQATELSGMKTLIEDASIKVNKGLTTVDEILRVLGPQQFG
jgi:type II secretory ATPase GspE/PulE/Tfp pilus assembly ATPase PilB-like protein